MKIAVVIVNFNSAGLLARCLAQLEKQTRLADHVLVVDNASNDNSQAAASAAADQQQVELLQLETNTGFARANNLALSRLDAYDYIVTLNPDAFAEPGFLSAFESAAQQWPDCASFASRMMRDDHTIDGLGDIYHISGLAWRSRHGQAISASAMLPKPVFSACAGAAMYKRTCVENVGGFDEDFFCYMEDVDLGYRLQLSGYECRYIPQAVVIHEGSAITRQYKDFALYHGHRNLVWVITKNTPLLLLPVVLMSHVAMSVVVGLYFALVGKGAAYLRAKWDALQGVSGMYRKRRTIERRVSIAGQAVHIARQLRWTLWRH